MSSTREAGPSSPSSSPAELSGEALSRFIWATKYRTRGERDVRDSWRRIARATASVEADPAAWEARFRAMLEGFRFLPGGRIQAGAGRPGAVLFNCFVLPGPGASEAAALAALEASVATLRAGGGVGCDFSAAPPRGWTTADGTSAPGPVAWLRRWDDACRMAMRRSARQGAMMGSLACDHPDVEAFAAAKLRRGALSRFNLSIAVTDAFLAAVRADDDWRLAFPAGAEAGRTVRARQLWDHILRCAWRSGEPGVLFVDRINAANNLAWRERIATTNPCGEIPLPDYGACDLGSLNLTAFVRAPFTGRARLDLAGLAATAATAVRLLDNVIDLSAYPLPEQAAAVRTSRRVGLGVTGLADALLMLGQRYGEPESLAAAERTIRTLRDAAYRASAGLAREKGVFPAFEREAYLARPFVARLPSDIRAAIAAHGIRNSHLLAIAPTGSISLLAGGVSSGLEPIFAGVQERRIRVGAGPARTVRAMDPALALWRDLHGATAGDPPAFVSARDLPIDAHLAMQAVLQPFVDNAISKTVNVAADQPFEAFRMVYERAFDLGLKGCTAYRAAEGAVLSPAACPALPPAAGEARRRRARAVAVKPGGGSATSAEGARAGS